MTVLAAIGAVGSPANRIYASLAADAATARIATPPMSASPVAASPVAASTVAASPVGTEVASSVVASSVVAPSAKEITSSVKAPASPNASASLKAPEAAVDIAPAAAALAAAPLAAVEAPAIAVTSAVTTTDNAIANNTTENNSSPAVASPATPAAATVLAALEQPDESLPKATLDAAPRTGAEGTAASIDASVSSIEVVDECFIIDTCVDRYLWRLYQRTPKEDSVREHTQRQVTVKKKGKLVTVTRTSTTVVDEDFGWKDGEAATKAGMTLEEYVIGGVDRDFKLRLFQMLHAADEAGLVPGITSGFRDDYRQSIASGLKAANDRSFHGGSSRGGYGHGLAADIVSVKGATRAERLNSSNMLWKWVDDHGSEFGLGRPYLSRDPPHVAPNDGDEYARHRGLAKAKQVTPPRPAKRAAL